MKRSYGTIQISCICHLGQEDVAKILIQNGADSNYTDENGLTGKSAA